MADARADLGLPSRARWSSPLVLVGLVVTLVCGYLAVRNVEFSETWAALESSNYLWLGPALLVFAAAIFLRGVRWQTLFVRSSRPPLSSVLRALLIGYFFNSVLPLRAGEVARIVVVKRDAGTSMAETTATVATERLYDVMSLLTLLFVALFWLPEISWITTARIFALVLGAAILVLILLLALRRAQVIGLGVRLSRHLPFLSQERGERVVHNLVQGLAGLTERRTAALALVWTFLSWGAMAVSFWLVMLCFDLELPLWAGLLVVIATSLSLVLPSSPAGLGVFEAATIVAMSAYSIPRAEALSYALVLHALNLLPFLLAGAIVLIPRIASRHSPSHAS